MSTTTTTTTTPTGETTIQKVEDDWNNEVSKIKTWLAHAESAGKASAWFSVAYAAYEFARHLV
jgi:hypothetical protein